MKPLRDNGIVCTIIALAPVICLAYGSNLHPFRLAQRRIRSARPIGVVPMQGKRLAFHKKSGDGSGKCLFYERGDTRTPCTALPTRSTPPKSRSSTTSRA